MEVANACAMEHAVGSGMEVGAASGALGMAASGEQGVGNEVEVHGELWVETEAVTCASLGVGVNGDRRVENEAAAVLENEAAVRGELVVVVHGDEREVKNEAVACDDEGVEGGEQGKGLAELHGHGGGGGHDDHGACGEVSRGTTVVPPAPTHGGEASHAWIQGAPSLASRHRVPEPVLLPTGRHGEAMRRRSTMRAQPQEQRGGRCPSCLWCLCVWSLHWLV
ncbi:hypothetical protein SETIT_7G095200v2 [Setaria italica]|uniref:Uncharacterized protein n=1 Tax=Setaria italica TaxID=4555 RepID=A0A368RU46_SETIT|nr:hypothetical protein SETIT_7G095200v2 [Setaria italica]